MIHFGGRVCGTTTLLLFFFGFAVASTDFFDAQQGDINYCKKQCQIVVKNKSITKGAILNACHHGCLLFSICQFVNDNDGFNASKEECNGACQEAYGTLAEQEACNKGCGNQRSGAESSGGKGRRRRRLKTLAQRSRPSSIMDVVSRWCSGIITSVQSFISSTWTFYLRVDDGKVVVLQSQPEADHSLPDPQGLQSDVDEMFLFLTSSRAQRPHMGGRQRGGKDEAGSKVKHGGLHAGRHADGNAHRHDLLGCMSRRSGLPHWILATCIFLSVMVMLWLSCSSLVTAPDQHVRSQLSISGNKDCLEDVHKVTPFHESPVIAVAISQSDESKEAGPLPVKVDLNKTVL